MKFRTEYIPVRSDFSLSVDSPVAFVGSCFADNLSARMSAGMWDARKLFGMQYNPMSIAMAIRSFILKKTDSTIEESIFSDGGIFHSWLFDSSMSAKTADGVIRNILTMQQDLNPDKISALFVTFGTSWCYWLKSCPEYPVANCHKQPAAIFERRRLSIDEIVGEWDSLLSELNAAYPTMKIIFTVSPVRHLKDGFEGNARSKAVLLLAVEELCRRHPECGYFPAYEIMNDDLRDYRFYASDLAHPSQEAVEYIWEIFRKTYMSAESERVFAQGEKLMKAWLHRPIITDADAYAGYRDSVAARMLDFKKGHPAVIIPPEMEAGEYKPL